MGFFLTDYDEELNKYYFDQPAPYINTYALGADTLVGVSYDYWYMEYRLSDGTLYEASGYRELDGNAIYTCIPIDNASSITIYFVGLDFMSDASIDLSRELPVFGMRMGICPGEYVIDGTYDLFATGESDRSFLGQNVRYLELTTLNINGHKSENLENITDDSIQYCALYTTTDFVDSNIGTVPGDTYVGVEYYPQNSYVYKSITPSDEYLTFMFYPHYHGSTELYETQIVKDIHNDVDDINDTTKSIDETNKSILEKIKELPTTLWTKFEEGLKALFIPEDGWLEAEFDKLKTNLEDALGFLAFPFVLVEEFLDLFNQAADLTDFSFTLPKLEFMGHTVWEEYTFSIEESYSELAFMGTLFEVLHLFCKFVIIIALCRLGAKKFNLILTGVPDNDS